MYHSISEDQEQGVHPYYRLATNPRRFGEQMQWLVDGGWSGVSLEHALLDFANGQSHERREVAITFDDGYQDFSTEAWPVLKRHGFTATMYLPTAFISGQRLSLHGKECLTWSEVKELRAQGVRFGSHTATHPKLHELPWKALEHELTASKTCLEGKLEEEVGSFAYPYAFPQEDPSFTTRLTEILCHGGYRSCVTTVVGRVEAGASPFSLKRLPVNSCDDHALFTSKLEGAYDWMGSVQRGFRQFKRWHRPSTSNGFVNECSTPQT